MAEVTDGVRRLLDDMAETMYDAPGIGLAAPQVNVSERLIVMDCGSDDAPELYKMINPEIVARSDDTAILEEGCLSIPKQTAEVKRPAVVDVRYTDIEGPRRRCAARASGGLRSARDRPSRRRAVHRPYLAAEARHDRPPRAEGLRQVNGGDQGSR